MYIVKDRIGQKFNRLLIICRAHNYRQHAQWLCLCDCGKETIVTTSRLIKGYTKSCGCYNREKIIEKISTSCYNLSGSYFAHIRNSAKRRKIEFNLHIEEIYCLFLEQASLCAISGINLILDKNYSINKRGVGKRIQTASLDRINPKLGYTINNVQWVHKSINTMKMELSNQDFIQFCHIISQYNKKNENSNSK